MITSQDTNRSQDKQMVDTYTQTDNICKCLRGGNILVSMMKHKQTHIPPIPKKKGVRKPSTTKNTSCAQGSQYTLVKLWGTGTTSKRKRECPENSSSYPNDPNSEGGEGGVMSPTNPNDSHFIQNKKFKLNVGKFRQPITKSIKIGINIQSEENGVNMPENVHLGPS